MLIFSFQELDFYAFSRLHKTADTWILNSFDRYHLRKRLTKAVQSSSQQLPRPTVYGKNYQVIGHHELEERGIMKSPAARSFPANENNSVFKNGPISVGIPITEPAGIGWSFPLTKI